MREIDRVKMVLLLHYLDDREVLRLLTSQRYGNVMSLGSVTQRRSSETLKFPRSISRKSLDDVTDIDVVPLEGDARLTRSARQVGSSDMWTLSRTSRPRRIVTYLQQFQYDFRTCFMIKIRKKTHAQRTNSYRDLKEEWRRGFTRLRIIQITLIV